MIQKTDDKEFLLDTAVKIRKLRIEAGFSNAKDFAREIEMHESYYRQIESGKINITLLILKRILDYHKLSIEFFLKK